MKRDPTALSDREFDERRRGFALLFRSGPTRGALAGAQLAGSSMEPWTRRAKASIR
jgi:hypothetical protein